MGNKPRIRFKGFTEDWEQRKLGEFVKIVSGDAPSTFISGNCIYVKVDDLNNSDRIQLSSSNLVNANPKAHLVNQGATIFPKRGAAIMTNKVRIMGKDGYLDTNMMALIPEEIDKDFLFTFIQKTGLYKIADTSTIPQINNKHIEPYMIQVPSEKEQAYIGVVFEKIDKIITLHQCKLEKLKLTKKALLQKLFPKNGKHIPEIRFKGFTDAWEQRKLIDTAKTFIGLVTTMTENYRDSGTLLIRNSDIKEGQFVFSEKPIHLDEEFAEKNKTRRLQIGDVVTVHTGDIGTSAVIQEKEAGAIGFATINTRTDKRILNPYFLSTYFNTEKHKCYANSVSTGDGRSNYNIKDFNKLVISIPTLDEQEKISVLINNINTIITLHQQEPFLCGNSINGGVELC